MSLELFDTKYKEYTHFTYLLARLFWLIGLKFNYIILDINIKQKLLTYERVHEDGKYYYEGYHNHLKIGWITINYGTK